MKTLKLLTVSVLAVVAIACDKGGGGGGAAAVPAQASAVCNGVYSFTPPNTQQQQWGGWNSYQNQVMCYPIYGYGYGGGYGGYGYGYGGGWNNGYNNGYNNTTAPQMRSNCAGYTLYEVSTGRQVTCQ